ncbi:MAG: tail fiber protein, partial [Pasteurellaceae bacterium]|nr:tail fiber protein [Pasteurellaceae bacterium]
MSKRKTGYKRTHDFAPYTRADGQAVSDEFDAIQAHLDRLPELRQDGLGFAESPVIPDATKDDHPVSFRQLKTGEQSVWQMKQEVEQKREEVARNTQNTATNTQTATAAKTQAVSYAQRAETSAQTASQRATAARQSATTAQNSETLARKWAVNPEDEAVQSSEFSAFHHDQKAKFHADRANRIAGGRRDWSDIDNIPTSSTARAGIVQLESSTSSTATNKAATPQSVKAVKDLADSKVSKSGNEDISGEKTFNSHLKAAGGLRVADSRTHLNNN